MQEPIIPGEVLITHDPDIETPKFKIPWRRHTAGALACYVAFVGADNLSHYYEVLPIHGDDGTMIEDVAGCPDFPEVIDIDGEDETNLLALQPQGFTEVQVQATLEVEQEFTDTESAANNFTADSFNPIRFVLDWNNIRKHQIVEFESAISGLEVKLYSDSSTIPFANINIETIDELIHASLSEDVEYQHIGVQAFADCMRYRFIDEDGPRELEDEQLNIYVPSRPGVCFSNKLVQDLPEGADYNSFCDSTGATLDEIRFAILPFYEYNRSWSVLMSHKKSPGEVNYKLSKMFSHEPIHFLTQHAGLPFRYNPNERQADYMQGEVIAQKYEDGLPFTISYPDSAYENFPPQE